MDIKVRHIFHSGFIFETEDILMVFDYYTGNINLKDKNTIVFASHGHSDHYTKEIFKWQEGRDNVKYVLAFDIEDAPTSDNIYIMNPYEELNIYDVNVKSFGSTDQGLSFLINYSHVNIFFSGDLNWWHWEGESQKQREDAEVSFKDEIEKIKKEGRKIDMVFFPVDPRLEKAFSFGGEHIIKELSPDYFFPMHFGDKFDTSKRFINKMGDIGTEIMDINKKGQVVELEI